MLPILLAAQVATAAPAPSAATPTTFSILQPIADEPCVRRGVKGTSPDDIVVCGKPLPSQKLPYPNEVVLDEPRPSNPDLRGTGALALEASPCASVSGGCGTGIDLIGAGVQLVRLAQKAVSPRSCCERPGEATDPVMLASDIVGGVKRGLRRKPDESKRIAIPMVDAPVDTAAKILP